MRKTEEVIPTTFHAPKMLMPGMQETIPSNQKYSWGVIELPEAVKGSTKIAGSPVAKLCARAR
jgi:hypothetical protein